MIKYNISEIAENIIIFLAIIISFISFNCLQNHYNEYSTSINVWLIMNVCEIVINILFIVLSFMFIENNTEKFKLVRTSTLLIQSIVMGIFGITIISIYFFTFPYPVTVCIMYLVLSCGRIYLAKRHIKSLYQK